MKKYSHFTIQSGMALPLVRMQFVAQAIYDMPAAALKLLSSNGSQGFNTVVKHIQGIVDKAIPGRPYERLVIPDGDTQQFIVKNVEKITTELRNYDWPTEC